MGGLCLSVQKTSCKNLRVYIGGVKLSVFSSTVCLLDEKTSLSKNLMSLGHICVLHS